MLNKYQKKDIAQNFMNPLQANSISQQSNISGNVSYDSTTTEFSPSVQDEPLCITPKRNVYFKSAEEDIPFIITPSKYEITISPYKKTTPSKFELKINKKHKLIQSNY